MTKLAAQLPKTPSSSSHREPATLRRQPAGEHAPATVPPAVSETLRSTGQPLDAATRSFMEPRFGHDFSQVKVHTDARASASAKAVHARAYTVGHDIVFTAGSYAPGTAEGRQLLAHELTHTLDQRPASRPGLQAKLEIGEPGDVYERQADRIAQQVTRTPGGPDSAPAHHPPTERIHTPAAPRLMRQPRTDPGWRQFGDRAGSMARSLKELEKKLTETPWESAADAREYLEGFLPAWFRARGRSQVAPGAWEYWATYHHYNDLIEARYPKEALSEPYRSVLGTPPTLRDVDPEVLGEFSKAYREAEARRREIEAIAGESGMSVADVEAIIKEYNREQTNRNFPGIIRPLGVPFLNTPFQQTARFMAPFLPYAGAIQAYYGIDIQTGQKLSTGERSLLLALDVVPIGTIVGGAARVGARGVAVLTRAMITQTARLATQLGMHPKVLLPMLGRLGRIGRRMRGPLRSAYAKLIRGGRAPALTAAERHALGEVARAAPELAGPAAQSAARTGIRPLGPPASLAPASPATSRAVARIAVRNRAGADTFMNRMQRRIVQDPKHPLRFLLETKVDPRGRPVLNPRTSQPVLSWRQTTRTTKSGGVQVGRYEGHEHGVTVQAGHQSAFASGAPQQYMVEDADLNQLTGQVIESKGRYILSLKDAVVIGGVPVDVESALQWERLGLLPPGTVAGSPRIIPPSLSPAPARRRRRQARPRGLRR